MPANSNKSAKAENGKRFFHSWFLRVLIPAFCLWLVFSLSSKVLCTIALEQIAELTNTKITTESVDFNVNGSVFIKGLVIRPEPQAKYDDTILKAETVYARFGIGSLLLLHPRLKKISVKDFVFDAQHNLDTDWWNISAFRIKTPKDASGEIPIIRFKRGTLQYSKVSNGQVKVIAAAPIDVEFASTKKTQDGYSFNIITGKKNGSSQSILEGLWKPGRITITGEISSADIPAFEKALTINAMNAQLNYDRRGDYSLTLKIEELRSRHTTVADIFVSDKEVFLSKQGAFTAMQRFFNRFRPSGTVSVNLRTYGNLERLSESKLVGEVYCKDITILDRRFPYLIKQLTGRIDLTEKSTVLNELCGRHGDTEVSFNGWTEGFGPNRKYQIRITSNNMALDEDLYEALSAKQKKSWSAFSPNGLALIDYEISRQLRADKRENLTVELLGAEAAYYDFPYPLENLSGRLLFADDSITVSDVTSQVNGREITINGKVTACSTERPIYDISVKAKNIPLDSTLASSLSDERSDFYNRLNMTGLADAEVKIFTPEGDLDPMSFIAEIALEKAFLSCGFLLEKADDFPLIISDISAKTVITPDSIQIEDFTGRYNQNVVSLTGQIWPGDKAQEPRYCLLLNAKQAELSDEFISLLPQQLGTTVAELQPRGKVNLTANLNKTVSGDRPDYKITVDCPGNSINFEPFAYPVKNITGRLTITKNTILLEDITAIAADNTLVTSNVSTVSIDGQITLADYASGGSDQNKLEILSGYITFTADNLRIYGKSLTSLKADTYYDCNQQSWETKNLIADCYGGRLAGKFELRYSAGAGLEYLLEAGFDNMDLRQFLSDTSLGDSNEDNLASGKMSGVLSVAGRAGESLPYTGRCRLQITDMEVGRLSPLGKLLYVLKLTEPKDYAFEQMLVDSYIKDKRLFLKHLDLSGKALAFTGTGRIDMESRNADLVLFARGRRLAAAEPSLLQSLTEGLGHGIVRLEVTGNVYDPKVITTPLPVIEDAVKIFIASSRR